MQLRALFACVVLNICSRDMRTFLHDNRSNVSYYMLLRKVVTKLLLVNDFAAVQFLLQKACSFFYLFIFYLRRMIYIWLRLGGLFCSPAYKHLDLSRLVN
ncbi:hypothetical protein RchiOBHm_Chr6g0245991 [Rosa chinensis]|uniref:Uncharacterized protein n=1 Tax=Rosa chinensis TaxID=74649 RepID=A0A2P6PJF3_ROSCH|nr:hypothetical protein RchiOBHm_Chr6g0245991 [Rosa chinensis]